MSSQLMKNRLPKPITLIAAILAVGIGLSLVQCAQQNSQGTSLDGVVKSILVCPGGGVTTNLDPDSAQGRELIDACEAVLQHLDGQIEGIIKEEEFLEELQTKAYAYLEFYGDEEIQFSGRYMPPGWTVQCGGLYFIFEDSSGRVMTKPDFGADPTGERLWPYGYDFDKSRYSSELRSLIEQIA
jgi:hypothetical protein